MSRFPRPAISRLNHFLALVFLLFAGRVLHAATPDDTARFLAGLPVKPGSDLAPLTADSAWVAHANFFNGGWARLDSRQLASARTWAATQLGDISQSSRPLFYMFSGPDFLYADVFFPYARTTVLCGLEPVGEIPDLGRLPQPEITALLANVRATLNSVLNLSFFITKDMRRDFAGTPFKGNLPALYVLLARTGHPLQRVEPVSLDRGGGLINGSGGATKGVRIVYGGAGGGSQTLYYFTTDLSDGAIKSNPGFLKFCAGLGTGNSLLKAASYLPHQNGFSRVREFILNQSNAIIEDDSGIPLRYFDPAQWTLRPYGTFSGPIELFAQYPQPDLAQLYRTNAVPRLPFGYGYRNYGSQSTLLLAVRRGSGYTVPSGGSVAPSSRAALPARNVEGAPPPPAAAPVPPTPSNSEPPVSRIPRAQPVGP